MLQRCNGMCYGYCYNVVMNNVPIPYLCAADIFRPDSIDGLPLLTGGGSINIAGGSRKEECVSQCILRGS